MCQKQQLLWQPCTERVQACTC